MREAARVCMSSAYASKPSNHVPSQRSCSRRGILVGWSRSASASLFLTMNCIVPKAACLGMSSRGYPSPTSCSQMIRAVYPRHAFFVRSILVPGLGWCYLSMAGAWCTYDCASPRAHYSRIAVITSVVFRWCCVIRPACSSPIRPLLRLSSCHSKTV